MLNRWKLERLYTHLPHNKTEMQSLKKRKVFLVLNLIKFGMLELGFGLA